MSALVVYRASPNEAELRARAELAARLGIDERAFTAGEDELVELCAALNAQFERYGVPAPPTAAPATRDMGASRSRPTIGHRVPATNTRAPGATEADRIPAAWRCPTGRHTYRVLDSVTNEKQRAADAAIRFASFDLGIVRPRLLWLAKQSAASEAPAGGHSFREKRDFWGISDRWQKTIGVLASLAPALVVQVAAHEMFHLTQPEGLGFDEEEKPALAYGARARDLLAVTVAGQEKIVGVHVGDRCPRGSSMFAGVAKSDDVLIAPNYLGEQAIWRNVGTSAQPEWGLLG